MRYKDLKAGEEYAYVRSPSSFANGWELPERVRLVDTTRYAESGYTWRRNYCPDDKGRYVKVTFVQADESENFERFVTLVQLRGPWADVLKEYETIKAAKDDARRQDNERRARQREHLDALYERAKAVGLHFFPTPHYSQHTIEGTFKITSTSLAAFLDAIENKESKA